MVAVLEAFSGRALELAGRAVESSWPVRSRSAFSGIAGTLDWHFGVHFNGFLSSQVIIKTETRPWLGCTVAIIISYILPLC